MTPRLPRLLAHCPLVVFIAYRVGADAEPRGYADWLVRVDNPFFNDIPGTRHYANWRVTQQYTGEKPVWEWFDFQGLETEDDLERVWFNPDLDGFRAEWIRLWGYGDGEPPAVLRHAYLLRPTKPADPAAETATLRLSAGVGPAPEAPDAHALFRVEGVLGKHFAAGGGRREGWLRPASEANPLGLDWIALRYGESGGGIAGASLELAAERIAAPAP